ncbi:MAG: Crp/Fnr family transcriptional regulator [Hyphomicrobiaceae bacterium]|nr:Crp/Fnr family transcriptional regulator [Hyphomicrobiaceae bacterium]
MPLAQTALLAHAAFEAGNSLLGALRPGERSLLAGRLHWIECYSGERLFSPGEDVRTAYFPLDGTTIALSIQLVDGREVHAGLIGREGAVGGIVSGGHKPAFARAEVETAGPILTLPHQDLHKAKARSSHLNDLFARYADCLFAQAMQTAACNAFHSAEQRVARWLLFLSDRVGGREIPLTQDRLGAIIGAHRVTVLRGMRPLQALGLIDIRRSQVLIRDRSGLELRACECRRAIQLHYERMLPGWHLPSEHERAAPKAHHERPT